MARSPDRMNDPTAPRRPLWMRGVAPLAFVLVLGILAWTWFEARGAGSGANSVDRAARTEAGHGNGRAHRGNVTDETWTQGLRLVTVDVLDGRPVGGCRVDVIDPRWGVLGTGRTDASDGAVDLRLAFGPGADAGRAVVEIGSATHQNARRRLSDVVEAGGSIALRGRGAISIRHPDELSQPGDVGIDVWPVARGEPSETEPLDAPRVDGSGESRMAGLRPGRAYDLIVRVDGRTLASFRAVKADVPPGEPHLQYAAERPAFVRIRIDGVRDGADCGRLRARIVPARMRRAGALVTWDADQRCGWADVGIGLALQGFRVIVEGSLGQIVGEASIERIDELEEPPHVELHLVDREYRLVIPSPAREPIELVTWESGTRTGVTPVQERVVESFEPVTTTRTTLTMENHIARDIDLGEVSDIVFERRPDGRLIIDPEGTTGLAVAVVSRRAVGEIVAAAPGILGTRREFALPAGTYYVRAGEDARTEDILLRRGARHVVRLADLLDLSGLHVVVRPWPGAPSDLRQCEVRVSRQAAGATRTLRSVAVQMGDAGRTVRGLAPGRYLVAAAVPGVATASQEVQIDTGSLASVQLSDWSISRDVSVMFSGESPPVPQIRAFVLPVGTGPKNRATTDASGAVRLRIVGRGDVAIQAGTRIWVVSEEDAADGTIELAFRAPGAETVEVGLSPWWAERITTLGVLCSGPGPRFVFGSRIDEETFRFRDIAGGRAMFAALHGGGIAVVRVPENATKDWVLDEPPTTVAVRVALQEPGTSPARFRVEVLEVEGVPVRDTVLAGVAGDAVPWGEPVTFLSNAAITVRAIGMNAQGGFEWSGPTVAIGSEQRDVVLPISKSRER